LLFVQKLTKFAAMLYSYKKKMPYKRVACVSHTVCQSVLNTVIACVYCRHCLMTHCTLGCAKTVWRESNMRSSWMNLCKQLSTS